MSLLKIICSFFEIPQSKEEFEATLIDPFLCDDCYKVICSYSQLSSPIIPRRCLLTIHDYEICSTAQGITINILKASIKSMKVQDHSNYLCLADHSSLVVQALQKQKHSQIVQKFSLDESQMSSFTDVHVPVSNSIGFGLNSTEKSSKFAKQRASYKFLQSQDDILSALPTLKNKNETTGIENNRTDEKCEKGEEEFTDFPDWAVAYLLHKYKVNK